MCKQAKANATNTKRYERNENESGTGNTAFLRRFDAENGFVVRSCIVFHMAFENYDVAIFDEAVGGIEDSGFCLAERIAEEAVDLYGKS